MSARVNLLRLYQDWRGWTEAERESILANDWRQVKICQAAKHNLQARIVQQTEQAQVECDDDDAERAAFDKQIRSLVNELIYLETRNGEFITEQRRATEAELDGLQRSNRTLGKIHKRYAPDSASAWESYS